jgi:hypothetical protein
MAVHVRSLGRLIEQHGASPPKGLQPRVKWQERTDREAGTCDLTVRLGSAARRINSTQPLPLDSKEDDAVLPQLPESDKREGAALVRRMVLLSLPSFIGPGLFWLLFAIPSDGKIAAAVERIPRNGLGIGIAMGVMVVAVFAQLFTVPMAAVTLFHVILRGPSGNRAAAVALFCICLAGFYGSFGWLFSGVTRGLMP